MYAIDYRPFKLSEVLGQKAIVEEMKTRSIDRSFPEVMIFEGPSGIGKTTMALIVSALINDSDPILNEEGYYDPNPESLSSKAIRSERFNRDTHFIDASVLSKDEVAEIEKTASSAPMFDRNKVLIIDEAQELTKGGKGIVLRLLEKKRENVHIILCTMDINAFDTAVKTRGQLYSFRTPSYPDIAEYLFKLAEEVGVEAPEEFYTEGLFAIANGCEGSVRYAIQNFERCVMGKLFTSEQISKELGVVSNDTLSSLVNRFLKRDKSVIRDISNFSSREFFFKFQKVIVNGVTYKNTGYVKEPWQESSAKAVAATEGVEELLEDLLAINVRYYREDFFIYALSKFFRHEVKKPVARVPIKG